MVISTVTHLASGDVATAIVSGKAKHLGFLQSMLQDIKKNRIDMEGAKEKNNGNSDIGNLYVIWVPGPEVLHDIKLAERILAARPASGHTEYAAVPLHGESTTTASFPPKIRTSQSTDDVSLYFYSIYSTEVYSIQGLQICDRHYSV